ncbi:MAG: nucleotidyltransferase domain-containing protein [Deltaproteobacteria bacterium]|nr:nucleotidyltransferase domain-containing protein [Deltaproteobacteria bacterium]
MDDLRTRLEHKRERLRTAHRRGDGGFAIGARFARWWRRELADLFAASGADAMGAALCATGSVGRGDASPWSDVDFVLLLPETAIKSDAEAAAEKMLYPLWDAKVKTGQQFGTIVQMLERAREDAEALTALLDAHFVAGDASLARALDARLDLAIAAGDYAGRIPRRAAPSVDPDYPPTVHVLEPDVKNSPGGMRDYQIAVWSAQARWGRGDLDAMLIERGAATRVGLVELRQAVDFLLRLRHEAQFRERGPMDVLRTAVQPEAAILLGYQGAGEAEAAKAMLKDYFAAADRITRFAHRVAEADVPASDLAPRDDIAPGAAACGDLLFLPEERFARAPRAEVFAAMARLAGTGLFLSERTKSRLAGLAATVDDDAREDAETARAFLDLLGREWAGDALRALHSIGLLGAYIPPFGDLRGLVPYDVFHSYPADEHTLIAIGFFDRLRAKLGPSPLVEIAPALRRPDLVRLALLLHDSGKVGGPGHLDRGARMAPVVCLRLGLSEDETDFVVRLVREHESLARAAHTRDIEDPSVCRELAERMAGDRGSLDALYVITYCDMRAVGPGVWTGWRADLLRALHADTMSIMTHGSARRDHESVVRAVASAVADVGTEALRDNYFAQMEREHPAWLSETTARRHLDALATYAELEEPVVRVSRGASKESGAGAEDDPWDATVCAPDAPGFLARVAGVFAAQNLNILGVQAFNTARGLALDTVQFIPRVEGIEPGTLEKRLTIDLRAVLSGERTVEELIAAGAKRILVRGANPHVATEVRIDNHGAARKTVVEVWTADRPGLLYRVTNAIFEFGLTIHLAKVNTIAGRAIDAFYVTDAGGEKVTGRRARELREHLSAAVG